jgi:Ricin-type beta-trefoil lectin domain
VEASIGSITAPVGAVTGYQGLCMYDRGALATNYNPVQVYTCNNTPAQQWTLAANGTLQILGMCPHVDGAGTTNGTAVDLYTCNNTAAQEWLPTMGGELTDPQSNLCLEDDGDGAAGTQVIIDTCSGTADQQWNLP